MSLRTEKVIVSLVLAAVLHPTFQWVGAFSSAHSIPAPSWLLTPLDRALPVAPGAVWLYVTWYPAAAIGLFAGRSTLRRLYLAYTLAFVGCVVVYIVFPVTIERPIIADTGLSATVLRTVYAMDRPINLFPSFHAAVAAILLHLQPPSRWLRGGLTAWMMAICAACLLTKQHYVLDVVAGLVVGAAAVAMVDAVRTWRASRMGSAIGLARFERRAQSATRPTSVGAAPCPGNTLGAPRVTRGRL